MTSADNLLPPPARFNMAQHLLDCNESRPTKTAYIDDQGSLSYGDLAQRIPLRGQGDVV